MDANDLGVFEDYIEAADEIEQESAWLSLEENEEIRINPNFNADGNSVDWLAECAGKVLVGDNYGHLSVHDSEDLRDRQYIKARFWPCFVN